MYLNLRQFSYDIVLCNLIDCNFLKVFSVYIKIYNYIIYASRKRPKMNYNTFTSILYFCKNRANHEQYYMPNYV